MDNEPIAPRWRTVRFGDVVELNTDRCADPRAAGIDRYVGLEHIEPEDLRIRRWGSVADGTTFTNLFRPGQVLFGKRRAYQRKVAVADFKGVCSSDIYVFESKDPSVLLPELLPFLCQTERFYEHAVGTSAGSLSPRTNWAQLAQYEFALPPLEEQSKLAELLLAANTACDALRSALAAATALQASTHHHCFAGIVASVRTASTLRMRSILTQVNDKGFSSLPILSVTIDGKVVRREALERHVSDETGEEKYIRALPGDIAYNTMRLWQGAVGVVQEEGLISPAYTVMRRIDRRYPVEYLAALLRSSAARAEYRRFVKGVASDRWRLYFVDLARIDLNLPSAEKAAEISLQLRLLDQAVQQLQTRHANAVAIRGSLVARFVEGVR